MGPLPIERAQADPEVVEAASYTDEGSASA
jgi:hypothetical protein